MFRRRGQKERFPLRPMYVRFTGLHYHVISPRIVVSDAGLVFFQTRAVGERRD